MQIRCVRCRPWIQAAYDTFTDHVRIDPLFHPVESARTSSSLVDFRARERTAWHKHPLGPHLIVTAGVGWTQWWREPKKEIHAGNVVHCDSGQKHWQGVTDTAAMSHIALQEWQDGTPESWEEKVDDADYLSPVESD